LINRRDAGLPGKLIAIINCKINRVARIKLILAVACFGIGAGWKNRRGSAGRQTVDRGIVIRLLGDPQRSDVVARARVRINHSAARVVQLEMQMWSGRTAGTSDNSQVLALRDRCANRFRGDRIFLHVNVPNLRSIRVANHDAVPRIAIHRATAIKISILFEHDGARRGGDDLNLIIVHFIPGKVPGEKVGSRMIIVACVVRVRAACPIEQLIGVRGIMIHERANAVITGIIQTWRGLKRESQWCVENYIGRARQAQARNVSINFSLNRLTLLRGHLRNGR